MIAMIAEGCVMARVGMSAAEAAAAVDYKAVARRMRSVGRGGTYRYLCRYIST